MQFDQLDQLVDELHAIASSAPNDEKWFILLGRGTRLGGSGGNLGSPTLGPCSHVAIVITYVYIIYFL